MNAPRRFLLVVRKIPIIVEMANIKIQVVSEKKKWYLAETAEYTDCIYGED